MRKAAGGVATAKFRQPDAAQTALLRASATTMIWGMFSGAEMATRGEARAQEVEEDVAERAAALGVQLAAEGGVAVLRGSGAGAVAVGCADVAGMQRLTLGFDGAAYDGRILRAEAVEAELWGASPCVCLSTAGDILGLLWECMHAWHACWTAWCGPMGTCLCSTVWPKDAYMWSNA